LVSRFTVHLIDSFPRRLFVRRRFGAGKGDFDFQTVQRTAERNAAWCGQRMAVEAVLASRDNRRCKLQNHFIAEPCRISQIAGCTADGSNKPVIGIHAHGDLMGKVGHGYRSLASATSHASRQSGQ
jgi:hypothetical protein